MVFAALAGLWAERRPIAAAQIGRVLAGHGVRARYRVADIGFGRQRLVDVVIGDPRAPDLVADWVEAETHLGLDGARVTGVRAGRVRLRARVVGGRLSLGSLDRLLPAPTGKAFALPALDLDVADARARVETSVGRIDARLSGRGRVDNGFRGTLAAVAPRLASGGCEGKGVTAALRVSVTGGRPSLGGPVRAASAARGGARAEAVASTIALTLEPALDGITGRATVAAATFRHPAFRADTPRGEVTVASTRMNDGSTGFRGDVRLSTGAIATAALTARAAGLSGKWGDSRMWNRRERMVIGYGDGHGMRLTLTGARLVKGEAMARVIPTAAGTPLAPIAARIRQAAGAVARSFDLVAGVQPEWSTVEQGLGLHYLTATSSSGARLRFRSGESTSGYSQTARLGHYWKAGKGWTAIGSLGSGTTLTGQLTLDGGGFPDLRARFTQLATNMPVTAVVDVQPYAALDARLAATGTTVRWTPGTNDVTLATRAMLSGPAGGGRVDDLSASLDARWNRGLLTLNPGCTPVSWRALSQSGVTLSPASITLCPVDGPLLSAAHGHVTGGARVRDVSLAGKLGSNPLTFAARDAVVSLANARFSIQGAAIRVGAANRATRLDLTTLSGALAPGGATGAFAGAAGQIGTVPLRLSDAAGKWRVAGGALALTGALTVSDTEAAARFRPLPAREVRLRLAGGRVEASAHLDAPGIDRRVVDVTLAHDLARGTGEARLSVPGLVFDKALQPDALTPVTFGVIADVAGTITGEGRVAWSDAGVTSTGRFRTAGTDLAAAFGPVQGIAGEIRFDDLLALHSAPDQHLTVASINSGIPITDGLVHFQTLGGTRVSARGEWPFAGGSLTLRPALLDFGAAGQRALTFELTGVDARQFLAQFDFRNMDATGTFDGVLPILFDQTGGRIEGGRLRVREGGGTIAYVGDLTRKDLGFWSNLAFQALKSLRYRRLGVSMDGPLAGEMITQVRFEGISQGQGAKSNFLIRRLQRLPFVFNVHIKAPFRGLINSAEAFYDPSRLDRRTLSALIEAERAATPVQPPASEKTP